MNPPVADNVKSYGVSNFIIIFGVLFLGLPIDWDEKNAFYQLRYEISIFDFSFSILATALLFVIYHFRRKAENKYYAAEIEKKEIGIKAKNDELQLLLKSSSAVVYRTKIDEGFTLLYSSENVQQVLGYTVEEMFAKNFWADNLHLGDAPKVFEEIPTLFTTGFFASEYRFKHKDGSWRWMRAESKQGRNTWTICSP